MAERITQQAFADHIGVKRQAVADMVRREVIDLSLGMDACRLSYCASLREAAAGRSSDGDYDLPTERARLSHHQANIASLEEEKLKGNLLDSDEVAEAWSGVIANFRAKILALPVKLASKMPGHDQREIVSVARALSNEALDELATYEIPETKRSDQDSTVAA